MSEWLSNRQAKNGVRMQRPLTGFGYHWKCQV